MLLSAIIGGASLGQAGPNLQYFQVGCASAKRVFDVIDRSAMPCASSSCVACWVRPSCKFLAHGRVLTGCCAADLCLSSTGTRRHPTCRKLARQWM